MKKVTIDTKQDPFWMARKKLEERHEKFMRKIQKKMAIKAGDDCLRFDLIKGCAQVSSELFFAFEDQIVLDCEKVERFKFDNKDAK